jgi:carbamoyl-phosphate synthase large subunit
VIIKPTNNRSSRGVHKISNREELAIKLPNTIACSREPSFLVEEYIGGFELSVEGFKTRKKHTSLAVSTKEQFGHNTVLDSRVFYPKDKSSFNYEKLKDIQDGLVNASGLPFGITHAEFKCWNDKFYVVEFAARGGGANISSHIIPMISGVDVNELLLRMAMGADIADVKPAKQDKAVVLEFFSLREGKVKSIHGFEKIQAMKNVVDAALSFKVGDVLTLSTDGGNRAGHFIAFAENDERLNTLCETIRKTLVVEYE